jgi:hypothetical protein
MPIIGQLIPKCKNYFYFSGSFLPSPENPGIPLRVAGVSGIRRNSVNAETMPLVQAFGMLPFEKTVQ